MDFACWQDCCSQTPQNVILVLTSPSAIILTLRIATVALIMLLRSRAYLTAQTFMPGWGEFARSCGLAMIPIPALASRFGSRLVAACLLRCWQQPCLSGTASAACRRQRAHPPGH